MMTVELMGCTLEEIEGALAPTGEPRYRALQIARWIYQRRAAHFNEMTDLPQGLRHHLEEAATLTRLRVAARSGSADGLTTKFLLDLADGRTIETVLMAYDDGRRSACVSTQVGCGMGCAFCATGMAGLVRSLTVGEIVDQVLLVSGETHDRVTHVAFMGMGEPLANYDATLRAVRLLNEQYGPHIGMRHMTISTVGLVPQIRRLAGERLQITLAVSLHAPTDDLRSQLVPVNRRWPLSELMAATRDYAAATGRRVTFEYVLMRGVNDHDDHASRLAVLLTGNGAHVNVIPWNPVSGLPYARPPAHAVHRFAALVRRGGASATVRLDRGVDIQAACGQLRQTRAAGVRA